MPSAAVAIEPVTTARVARAFMEGFWAKQFGLTVAWAIRFETAIFEIASQLSPSYQGGNWSFFTTSNGGAFIAPERLTEFDVDSLNGLYHGRLGAEAFGFVVTQIALSQLMFALIDTDHLVHVFDANQEFGYQHQESGAIALVLD